MIEEKLLDITSTHQQEINDEISDEIDMLYNPSEEQSHLLAAHAQKQANSAVEKMGKFVLHLGKVVNSKTGMKNYFWKKSAFQKNFHMGLGVI